MGDGGLFADSADDVFRSDGTAEFVEIGVCRFIRPGHRVFHCKHQVPGEQAGNLVRPKVVVLLDVDDDRLAECLAEPRETVFDPVLCRDTLEGQVELIFA